MINQHIPDSYYSKTMMNSCLLRSQGQNISWKISDLNRDNPQTKFDINILILKFHARGLLGFSLFCIDAYTYT